MRTRTDAGDSWPRKRLGKLLENHDGVLRLAPAWVAREDCRAASRLGLPREEVDKGERGHVTERWLASDITADNRRGPAEEGLSFIQVDDGAPFSLREALRHGRDLILGREYAASHAGLDVLVKVIDFADRIFFHYHQTEPDALRVARRPKEESYYFPEDADPGEHPESFFGVHPYIHEQKKYELFLQHVLTWSTDSILKLSRAYLQAPDDGFHIPAGIPHSPGTSLTIEIQERSDVSAVLQGLYRGKVLSKERLFQNIAAVDRAARGERVVLEQIDWARSCDPYFYENRHTPPIPIGDSVNSGSGREYWIFYNTRKYSGKRVIVFPGKAIRCVENGAYSVLVWKGRGRIRGNDIEGRRLGFDELIVTHDAATEPTVIENTSAETLELFKFFGPDINPEVPMLPHYIGGGSREEASGEKGAP